MWFGNHRHFVWCGKHRHFMWLILHRFLYKYVSNGSFAIRIISFYSYISFSIVKFNMSQEGDEKIQGYVRYESLRKTVKVMLTPTDKLSDLKVQLNSYFEHIGSDETAKHLFAQEPYISLADDEDWLWRYKIHSLADDAAVVNMFESFVMDNKLHMCVRSVCNCQNCR